MTVGMTENVVEDAALAWFEELGYERRYGPDIALGEPAEERASFGDVVLVGRLRKALKAINEDIPAAALDDAVRRLLVTESPSLAENNRRFHQFVVEGVPVEFQAERRTVNRDVKLLDFDDVTHNDWLVVNQFTVVEGEHNRRPDIVVFVNGLPLAVVELKNPTDENATIKGAFNQLQTYKQQIPSLFTFNEALVASDGTEARVGSLTAGWDRFMPWRTIDGTEVAPKGTAELGVMVKGVFEKTRFLDLIRHFIVCEVDGVEVTKKMAGYHQFHAVNKAVDCTLDASSPEGDRRVGVIWHTQGSGKSLSMAFYAGKIIQRPEMENPTLVVLTDRNDLDDQLFDTFAACNDLLRQAPVQAESREHLRELLAVASGGVVFTTIQKFAPLPSPLAPLPEGEGDGTPPSRPSPRGGRSAEPPSPSGRGVGGEGHYRGGLPIATLVEYARDLRQNQTPAEELMWKLLRNRQFMGLKFRRQHQIGNYIVDFYCHERQLVLEIDGEAHDTPEAEERDRKRDAQLTGLGFSVLRLPNEMVLGNPGEALTAIEAFLSTARAEGEDKGGGEEPPSRPSPNGGRSAEPPSRPSPRGGRSSELPSPSGRGAGGEGACLSERHNIIFIADEAHRSQYGFQAKVVTDRKTGQSRIAYGFAKYVRDALPNASFIGFTGTPIESEDRSTPAVFGDYIDIYDIGRAVEDEATVRIYYEGRLAKIALAQDERPKIDPDFEEVTEGQEAEQKERLKTRWARLEAMVGAEKRVKLIADDLVTHFDNRQAAMSGKAMIVGMSRRICVDLYNAIAELRPEWHDEDDKKGCMKVVMTGNVSEEPEWQQHIRTKRKRRELAKRFKDPRDPFQIVIVRDMWLTGFDAPSLHTMYVDKPMRGHGLMQAIARVNRVFKDKQGGLVVDYLGLADELKRALTVYTDGDRRNTGIPQDQAVGVLLEKHEVLCAMMHPFDWRKFFTGTPEERLGVIPAAMEHILELDNGKTRFLDTVTALSSAFTLAGTHDDALAIREDVAFFQAVRAAFVKHTQQEGKSPEEIDTAIRQIISRAVASEEVIDIFAKSGLRKPDISILSDEFLAEVNGMQHKNLALEMLRKLLNDEIKHRSRTNIVQGRSFAEMLEKTIKKYQNRTIEAAQVILQLIELAKEMREANKRGEALGLTDDELCFYDALEVNDSAVAVLGDETLRAIAQELVQKVRSSVTIDWAVKESVRARLRAMVKRILRNHGYPPDKQEKATQTVLSQAEVLCDRWVA